MSTKESNKITIIGCYKGNTLIKHFMHRAVKDSTDAIIVIEDLPANQRVNHNIINLLKTNYNEKSK